MLILILVSATVLVISLILYRGGINAINFVGDRHWDNLNRYEGEEDDGRKLR